MDNSQNKTPPLPKKGRGNEETGEDRGRVVGVPPVVEIVVVHVPPTVVPVQVADVQVPVGVAITRETSPITLLLEYSQSCILCAIYNRLTSHAEYLHEKIFTCHAISNRSMKYSGPRKIELGSKKP